MGKAIGIDLGTTNSVVAFKDTAVKVIQTGVNNEDLCRSCVALDKSGQFLVGNSAYKNWKRYSPNIVVSVKRLMGTGFSDPQVQKMSADNKSYPYGIKKPSGGTDEAVAIILRGQEYSPEQISAEIIKSIRNDVSTKLGDSVTDAVITVPAYFSEKQKTATRKAAELVGLRVQRLLAEPTAAAISYGFDKMIPGESKHVLVYDFGGGTFDLSILMAIDGEFIESGSGGDRWLGGDDIDSLLSDYVCREIEKREGFILNEILDYKPEKDKIEFISGLKSSVEEAKKTLSQVESATIFFSDFLENEDGDPIDDYVLTRDKFENLIRPLIQRTIDLIEELLNKTSIPVDTIDNILLVGGSSCIPLVRKMLSEKYGVEKILSSEKPMLAIAEGAAILAQSLPSQDEEGNIPIESVTKPIVSVVTTTKHQTFIQLEGSDGLNRMEKIIDSQEVLPFEANRKFYTTCDNQKIVEIKLFEDSENGGFIKTASGFFAITDNLPAHSDLNFTFNLDENETLSATVKIVKTGKIIGIRLGRGLYDSSCLSELSQKVNEVLLNNQISSSKKATFISETQIIIETINKNNYSPSDAKWKDLEQEIRSSYTRALMGEKQENNLGEIFSSILLINFSRFLNSQDANELRDGQQKLKRSNDKFERDSIRQDLEKTSNKYSLLIQIYLFKLIGDNSSDPRTAGRAICAFDEMMNALNNNNINEINEIIRSNTELLEPISNGDFDIGIATGIV